MTDRDDFTLLVLAGVLALSAAVHALTFVALGWVPLPDNVGRELAAVDVEMLEPEPEAVLQEEQEEEEEEEEPELAEPEPPPPPPEPRERTEPPPPPPDEPPPPAEETPVAFDNLVLTNETSESSFAMEQASGEERDGPIGTPGAQVTGRSRRGQRDGTPGGTGEPDAPRGPRVVAMADLSQRPALPGSMSDIVRRYYPDEARQQGIEGVARVGIQVDPDGSLRTLGVISESWEGFGRACQQALRRSPRWGIPRDAQGRPVAVRSFFACRFELY